MMKWTGLPWTGFRTTGEASVGPHLDLELKKELLVNLLLLQTYAHLTLLKAQFTVNSMLQ